MTPAKDRWPVAARIAVAFGALNLALATALAAAGAHAFRTQLLAQDSAAWFDTAGRVHELHALGLVAIGLAIFSRPANRWFQAAAAAVIETARPR